MDDKAKAKLIEEVLKQADGYFELAKVYGAETRKLFEGIRGVSEFKMEGECPNCEAEALVRCYMPFGGPYSGSVRCDKCSYHDSFYGYFLKTTFTVEPLPVGALEYFRGNDGYDNG